MSKYNKDELEKLITGVKKEMVAIEKDMLPLQEKLNEHYNKHFKKGIELERIIKKYHGINEVAVGEWECEDSVLGVCYYDPEEDPALDECLICGMPDERK